MVKRNLYLNKISEFIDKPFVKVITGLRRSGKSTILILLKEELKKRNVHKEQIVYLNFESFEFSHLNTSSDLYNYVKGKVLKNGLRYYIFLDEVQMVGEWEKAVNSFLVDFNADIYITGSNSQLLSSELATYLAGRYVEFQVFTISFAELFLFKNITKDSVDIYKEFLHYLRMGGFPVLYTANYSFDTAYKIVYDIYSSAILRDTIQRNKIRDVELLERVVRYVFDNIGNNFSAKKVADYFKSQQRKVDFNTVYNYLKALEEAYIIHRIQRYDIKGKEILKTQEKYYMGDIALLYAIMGYKDRMISGILENIVMLELKRKGFKVFVGKSGLTEIDFVAEKTGQKIYVQVAYLLSEPSTIEREFSPLLKVKDHYPKYVVTMDNLWKDNIDGVIHINIADFLLMDI
ncbi:MAG: ATP-binding protein [Bacteroidales bacterium]|nr:ATP-binding protein [Bacteroidales bacterium]